MQSSPRFLPASTGGTTRAGPPVLWGGMRFQSHHSRIVRLGHKCLLQNIDGPYNAPVSGGNAPNSLAGNRHQQHHAMSFAHHHSAAHQHHPQHPAHIAQGAAQHQQNVANNAMLRQQVVSSQQQPQGGIPGMNVSQSPQQQLVMHMVGVNSTTPVVSHAVAHSSNNVAGANSTVVQQVNAVPTPSTHHHDNNAAGGQAQAGAQAQPITLMQNQMGQTAPTANIQGAAVFNNGNQQLQQGQQYMHHSFAPHGQVAAVVQGRNIAGQLPFLVNPHASPYYHQQYVGASQVVATPRQPGQHHPNSHYNPPMFHPAQMQPHYQQSPAMFYPPKQPQHQTQAAAAAAPPKRKKNMINITDSSGKPVDVVDLAKKDDTTTTNDSESAQSGASEQVTARVDATKRNEIIAEFSACVIAAKDSTSPTAASNGGAPSVNRPETVRPEPARVSPEATRPAQPAASSAAETARPAPVAARTSPEATRPAPEATRPVQQATTSPEAPKPVEATRPNELTREANRGPTVNRPVEAAPIAAPPVDLNTPPPNFKMNTPPPMVHSTNVPPPSMGSYPTMPHQFSAPPPTKALLETPPPPPTQTQAAPVPVKKEPTPPRVEKTVKAEAPQPTVERKSSQAAAVSRDVSPRAAVSDNSAAKKTTTPVEAVIPPAETNGVASESEVSKLAEEVEKTLVVSQSEKEVVKQEENEAPPTDEAAATPSATAEEPETSPVTYRDGYWNPTSQNGKKAYNKEQFLQIKELAASKVKPANMPKYDIVRDNINTHNVLERRGPVNMPMTGMDFTPNFMRGQSGGYNSSNKGYGNMSRGGSNSMQGRRNIKPQKIIDAKPTIKATLKTTDNAWVPTLGKQASREGSEKMKASLTGLLNKLTPENYEKIQPQIRNLLLLGPEYFTTAINTFYTKAIDEPHFSNIYAKVCKSMAELTSNATNLPDIDNLSDIVNKFKRDLLVKCQMEFERSHQPAAYEAMVAKSLKEIEDCTDEAEKQRKRDQHMIKFENKCDEKVEEIKAEMKTASEARKAELELELEYQLDKFRKRAVGLIKFVGELYKSALLSMKIMVPLLEKFGENIVQSHTAEALCKLMTTIGAFLWKEAKDSEKAKITGVINLCREYTKSSVIENRIKFLLLDIIELFDNKFVPKHNSQKTEGPSTKLEVHNKMIMEEENEKISLNNTRSSNIDNRDRRGGRGSMNKESLVSGNTEVWKTVLNSNTSSKKNNSLRNLNNRHSEASGETPRLGPGGSYSAWGFGASGGSGGNKDNSRGGSMSGEPRQQSNNRFMALQDDDMPDFNNISNKRSSNRLIRDNPFKSNNSNFDRKLTRPEIPVKKPLNLDAIRDKTVANVEEYCSIQDIKEAVMDIESKFESRELPHYVHFAMVVVFELKDIDRESLGKLFEHLLVNKKISRSDVIEGLKFVVADVDDLACDIPQIQDYIGRILAPLVFNSHLPLADLLSVTAGEKEKVSRTFAKALTRMSIMNKADLLALWYQSRLKFDSLLGSEAEANKFFDMYEELKYLNYKEENQRVEVYSNCLKKSLSKPVTNDKIKRIVASFVGAGIPVPYNNSTVIDEQVDTIFEKLSALKMVMKSEGLENKDNFMAVLYGLQAIAVQHSVPPGLLETLFSSALDSGVVDEANIMDWENNPDQKLMGNCVASLGNFLRTLKTAKE